MRALILVDLQYDFFPGGRLAVPGGDEVMPFALKAMAAYPLVVATQDWHPADHRSFASQHPGHAPGEVIDLEGLSQVLWPDHCVQDTHGAEFVAPIEASSLRAVFRKGQNRDVDSYSGFFDNGRRAATGMGDWLKEQGVTSVDVLGLATDYCVKFTALDAASLGFETRLLLTGCRGVNIQPGDDARAVQAMRDAGVAIVEGPSEQMIP